MAKILFLTLFLLIFSLIPHSFAEIKTLKIISDNRPMILFEKFGFTHTDHVAVAVSSVSVSSNLSPPDPSRLGFFLLSEESLLQVLLEIQQNPSFCVLDSQYTTHLFTFRDLSPPPASSFNQFYPVSIPNEYSLFFANCNLESSVSMIVRTEMYNLEFNRVKDYLPAGQTQLPSLFFLFSSAYFVFLGYWVFAYLKNKKSVHRIHLLMAGLLIIKALNLICAAEDKHCVKVTGSPHGWVWGLTRVKRLFFKLKSTVTRLGQR